MKQTRIHIAGLGVDVDAADGVVYPNKIFGPGFVLVENSRRGAVLLPNAAGAVPVKNDGIYRLEQLRLPFLPAAVDARGNCGDDLKSSIAMIKTEPFD